MVDFFKAALMRVLLLLASAAGVAHADCKGGIEPSQLRLVGPNSVEASQGPIAAADFPAIAASGTEVAVLRSLDAAEASVALDVMRVDGGGVLKRFVLVPEFYEDGDPLSATARAQQASSMSEANEYLAAGGFRALHLLFELEPGPAGGFRVQGDNERHGVRVDFESQDYVLQLTSLADEARYLRLEWPARRLEPAGPGGMIQCGIQEIPIRGWIDKKSEWVVLKVLHAGGPAHGCDEPEEWRVVRLPRT